MNLVKRLLPVVLLASSVSALAQSEWTTVKTADLSQFDQVRYAQLTADEKTALQTLTATAILPCGDTAAQADTFQHVRARRTELGNGDQGFVVEGSGCLCNMGNCSYWIVTAAMQVLFHGDAQTYALLPQADNGRYQLVTASHVSTTTSARALYKFNGTQYQAVQCAEIAIANVFGNVQMKPTITTKACQ